MRKTKKLVSHPAWMAAAFFTLSGTVTGCSDSKSKSTSTSTSNTTSDTGGAGGSGGSDSSASGGSGGSGGTSSDAGGAAGAGACESPALDAAISIVGAYRDSYDGSHRVTDDLWAFGDSLFHVVDFSNDERFIVAQNDDDNEFNPSLYSRFEWTLEGEDLYYCQSVFDAESEEDISSAERADANDLGQGCGGFSWSQLVAIELVGTYEDDFGGQHDISTSLWQFFSSNFHIVLFSNEDRWAVAQNDCDNTYNPGLYSRFDWTEGDQGAAGAAGAGSTLHYCQTGFDLESEQAATELSPADGDDLEEGCSGFSWSALTPRQ